MRHFIIAAGILAIAVHANAQSANAQSTKTQSAKAQSASAPPAESTPALTKTVTVDPNDSPMVRAAKKAVASRVNPAQRRVVSINSTNTRGRFAIASGPVEGPKVQPLSPSTPPAQPSAAQQEAAKRAAAVQKQVKKLEAEANKLGAEMDEPYGNDLDEDQVEMRLYESQKELQKLQTTTPNPPPPPPPNP
jgi:hypothetical protein